MFNRLSSKSGETVSNLGQASWQREGVSGQSVLPILAALTLAAVFFVSNAQILVDWRIYSFDDGTYSHAYLIPFISAYLFYAGWKRGAVSLRWSWSFCVGLVCSLLVYQWFDLAHQRYLSRVMVPLCLCVAFLTIFPVNRYVFAAPAMFWFVTPVWGPISAFLQWMSVQAVATMMSFTDIPVFVFAEYVQIPAGTFEIADGCSGLRYVIATLALVFFYSALYLKRLSSFVFLILISLFAALIVNWLRIVALILIGHFTDMQSSLISDHNTFGWFLFVPIIFFVFRFADWIEAREESDSNHSVACDARSHRDVKAPGDYRPLLFVTIVVVCFSGFAVRTLSGFPSASLDQELDVQNAVPAPLPLDVGPVIYGAESIAAERYNGDVSGVSYRVSFAGATDAQRAEFYLNDMIPGGWLLASAGRVSSEAELLVVRDGKKALIGYAYRVGSTWTRAPGDLRLLRLFSALSFDRSSELAWSLVYCEEECGSKERLALSDNLPMAR